MKAVSMSVTQAACYLGVPPRTVRHHCGQGRFKAERLTVQGVEQYRISLDSLPEEAQAAYWRERIQRQPVEDRREAIRQLNLEEAHKRNIAKACGVFRKDRKMQNIPWTAEEFHDREQAFIRLPGNVQKEASRRAQLMRDLETYLRQPGGGTKTERIAHWAAGNDTAPSTVYEWRKRIANREPNQWPMALVPDYGRNGRRPVEVPPEIMAMIEGEWGTTSKPALKPIYRRAQKVAAARGLTLPSYPTILRRIDALPRLQKILMREGERGLDAAIPSMRRDYTGLSLHQMWNSDGRMADVHCRWPDGHVGRPVVVAFLDLRSRVFVGWAIGKSESANLVRQALADALRRTKAVPQRLYLDNGRAFASKEITGGQPTRYRFKVNEDDETGLATLLHAKVTWATPYNGKAKPIESAWNVVAENVDKRREFVGAYCGNAPHNKPETHDTSKAVPIELYERILREEIEAYHQREHRGDGMEGQSPMQVYERLSPDCIAVQPTELQLKCCLLTAQQVTLTREREIVVLGNRYGSDELLALNSKGPFTARYDPQDSTRPVHLFDGERFLMEVPLIAKTGFLDRDAAQEFKRANNARKRAVREQVRSQHEMDKARSWDAALQGDTPAPDGAVLPRVGVPQLLKPAKDYRPRRAAGVPSDDGPSPEELAVFRAARDRGQAMDDALMQEHEPRRAAGGL